MITHTHPLILASQSAARKRLLQEAGIDFITQSPKLDEGALQKELAHLSPHDLAGALAMAKALSISHTLSNVYVIGADQTLEFEGHIKHKAKNRDEALANLRAMSGKWHQLHSAVCVAQNGKALLQFTDSASLLMRPLNEEEITAYVKSEAEALLHSVGGYYIEGAGEALFSEISGDKATIMGLPLSALLAFLRGAAIISP